MERAPATFGNCLYLSKGSQQKIKLRKCQFFKKKHLHNPGHLISKQGIQPLSDKVKAIKKLKEPTNIDELLYFLGPTDYYR